MKNGHPFFSLIGRGGRAALLIVGVSAVIFIVGNVLAYYAFPQFVRPMPRTVFDAVVWPHTAKGQELLPKILSGPWDEVIKYHDLSPGFAMHPVLSFVTAPVKNDHFVIGAEGIRLEPGWNDEFVNRTLPKDRGVIFLLGGSTVLGHGVGADHTISYFMNRTLGSRGTVLNFGSQAYDQHQAIEKLLYLLRGGYRPEIVIFLDGWNDIMGMARSNLRTRDKLVYHGFATDRGAIAFTPGDRIDDRKHLRVFLESLPLYRLMAILQRGFFGLDAIHQGRDSFTQGFDFYEAEFVFNHWVEFADRDRALLKEQIVENLSENQKFIQALARGFGFRVYSFYQPIGLLDPNNPFVGDSARTARGYEYVLDMDKVVREAIATRQLPMIDISQDLSDGQGRNYVDVAHYSPRANKIIAGEILGRINPISFSARTQ